MKLLKNLFWNDREKRLRMFWRMVMQSMVMLLFLLLNQILLNLLFLLISGNAPLIPIDGDPIYSNDTYIVISTISTGFAVVLSVWISGVLFDRRRFADFGFFLSRDWWVDFAFGLGLGAILMVLIFLIQLSAGWISITETFITDHPDLPFSVVITFPLVSYIIIGFYEELLSRGYHLTNLAEGFANKRIGPKAAIILATLVSSALFGLMHAVNPNTTPLSSINIAIAGLFLSTGYLLTGQLAIPIGLHISWNFFQGNVFGFPVSGGNYYSLASFVQIVQKGPGLWTGGPFGPEGGLLGTASSILGMMCILCWVHYRTGRTSLQTTISQPPKSNGHQSQGPERTPGANPAVNTTNDLSSRFENVAHVIWDWNGTLLDDLQLCLDTINNMLDKRNLPELTIENYLDRFGFPVKDYYQKIGFDFDLEPFEEISTEFITAYEKGRPACQLMTGAREIIQALSAGGYTQSIVSASKQSYLLPAIEEYSLSSYFNSVNGINDHHASGKLDIAKQHYQNLCLSPDQILLIGDTLHDAEIANTLGVGCLLIPGGHQSRERLFGAGVPVVDSLAVLLIHIHPS